ncbi:MAG: hypothetical protein AAFZ11_11165 [Pseudomonadota bacterium]
MKAPSPQTLSKAVLGAALLPLATLASVAACASEAQPAPSDEGVYENYLDAPQTPGTWTYEDEPAESLGLYGIPDPAHPFVIRCDKRAKRIGLARSTTREGPLTMVLTAETTTRQLVAQTVEGYGLVAVDLDPKDPLIDAMAITKGRFVVELEGEPTLYIPAWTEFSRVIEDCR